MQNNSQLKKTVILPSKIRTPSVPADVIVRREVTESLERSVDHLLTTIVSPAGYGKTTAVVAWVRSLSGVPVAWLTLDGEDRSADRFWLYLTAALITADRSICRLFDETQFVDDKDSIRKTIDELIFRMGQYGRPFICVIEDFHMVGSDDLINDTIRYLMKHLPENAHFVITSRQPLRFVSWKMRLDGVLNELTEENLHFSERESSALFSKMGLVFTDEEESSIYSVTQGWPLAVRLIGLLGKQKIDTCASEIIRAGESGIYDYLFEEILYGLPAPLYDFMVKTSIVNAFSLALVERLLHISRMEAAWSVNYLVENGLFIEKIEHESGESWYRYHHLLANALHLRLEQMDSKEFEKMSLAARDWFEENGYFDYSVELSANIKDYDKIRDIIIRNWMSAYMDDGLLALLRWASFLPEREINKSPFVCAILAMPYALKGERAKANACLANAQARLCGDRDFLHAFCMVQEAFLASFRNEPTEMLNSSEAALECLPEEEYYLRGMMYQVQASSYADSDPLYTKSLFLKAVGLQCGYGNKTLSSSVYCNLAKICAELGYIQEARQYLDSAFALYGREERRAKPMLSYAYLANMICTYEEGDFEGVLALCDLFESSFVEGSMSERHAQAQMIKAKALKRLGSGEAAAIFFQALSTQESGALLVYPLVSMVKDYGDQFKHQVQQYADRVAEKQHMRVFSYMLSFVLDQLFRYEEVCDFAESISIEERYAKAHALLIAALFSEKVAQYVRAERYLRELVTICHNSDLPEVLRGNATYLRPLAERVSQARKSSVAAIADELVEENASTVAFRGLTDREVGVVRLVASGLTVAQSASSLNISRETAKKHLSSVYSKLGVHSKMQAVAMLREYSIL